MIVIFDLDNTLMKNPMRRWVFPRIERIIKEAGGRDVDFAAEAQRESVRLRLMGRYVESYDWDLIAENVMRANGVNARVDVAELVRLYCRPPFIRLEPGARELLKELRENGHRVVLLTNGFERYQLPVVEALGISDYDRFVSADRIGYIKPQPEAFLLSVKGIEDGDPRRPTVVGDSIFFDVWGAVNAGFQAIWRRHRSRKRQVYLGELEGEIRRIARSEGLEGMVSDVPNQKVHVVNRLSAVGALVMG